MSLDYAKSVMVYRFAPQKIQEYHCTKQWVKTIMHKYDNLTDKNKPDNTVGITHMNLCSTDHTFPRSPSYEAVLKEVSKRTGKDVEILRDDELYWQVKFTQKK